MHHCIYFSKLRTGNVKVNVVTRMRRRCEPESLIRTESDGQQVDDSGNCGCESVAAALVFQQAAREMHGQRQRSKCA